MSVEHLGANARAPQRPSRSTPGLDSIPNASHSHIPSSAANSVAAATTIVNLSPLSVLSTTPQVRSAGSKTTASRAGPAREEPPTSGERIRRRRTTVTLRYQNWRTFALRSREARLATTKLARRIQQSPRVHTGLSSV